MLKPSGFRRRSRREVVDGETHKTNMRRAELIAFSRDKARWMEHSMGIRQPVRVLLIDDSILTLHGLKTFLSKSSHIDIVGVARTQAEALAAIQMHRPNVVVLEVRVGQASGVELCRTIRESRPNIGGPLLHGV